LYCTSPIYLRQTLVQLNQWISVLELSDQYYRGLCTTGSSSNYFRQTHFDLANIFTISHKRSSLQVHANVRHL